MSDSPQLSFELPSPPAGGEIPLVPARMVNEWVYCPRLAWLEWVDANGPIPAIPRKAGASTRGLMPADRRSPNRTISPQGSK